MKTAPRLLPLALVALFGQGLIVAPGIAAAPPDTGVLELTLDKAVEVEPRNVTVTAVEYRGSRALEVRRPSTPPMAPDIDTFAYVPGLDFHDGTIEVEVAGAPLPGAPPGARGFVGVVFRVDAADGFSCEGIYLRPTNGRAADQVRRNHSTQYFSFPGYDFDGLRRESPGKYESYVDLVPAAWTKIRIEVSGQTAQLFVHNAEQPVLIVNDLKHGADAHGSVGLYVDNGTDGHFRNLRVTRR